LQPVFPTPSAPPIPVSPAPLSREEQETQDFELARKLVLEEIAAAKKKTSVPVPPPVSFQTPEPLTDSCLARQLDAEERQKVLYQKDLELAKKLDAEERKLLQEEQKKKHYKNLVCFA